MQKCTVEAQVGFISIQKFKFCKNVKEIIFNQTIAEYCINMYSKESLFIWALLEFEHAPTIYSRLTSSRMIPYSLKLIQDKRFRKLFISAMINPVNKVILTHSMD